jgi:tetratricopeptide (TPR) repeat protein
MKFSKDWIAYQFNFKPDGLKHFALVYQNHFFRVYRVLWDNEEFPVKEQLSYEPLFDESIFERFVSYQDNAEPDSSKYFYDMMNGLNYYDTAVRILQMNQESNGPAALELLKSADNICKYIPQVYILRAQIYERMGENAKAADDAKWALELRPNDPFAKRLYESNHSESQL